MALFDIKKLILKAMLQNLMHCVSASFWNVKENQERRRNKSRDTAYTESIRRLVMTFKAVFGRKREGDSVKHVRVISQWDEVLEGKTQCRRAQQGLTI
jgi:hypothetical protein